MLIFAISGISIMIHACVISYGACKCLYDNAKVLVFLKEQKVLESTWICLSFCEGA